MSTSAQLQPPHKRLLRSASGDTWNRWEAVDCVLCGPGPTRFRYLAWDWRYGNEGEFRVVECEQCGLAFLSPRPVADEAPKFYPDAYPAHDPALVAARPPARGLRRWLRDAALNAALGYPTSAATTPLARAFGQTLAPIVRRRAWPRYRTNGRLLDVGFGRGDYLEQMRANGWDVYGVDLSPRAVAEGRKKGLQVFQGTLASAAEFLPRPLDAITFFDSFEHHPDPIETLEVAAQLLRADGELLIIFPNYGSPWRHVFGRYWADLAPPQHFFYYTAETLTRMIERCGFSVGSVYSRPSSEIQRSLQILQIARGNTAATLPSWARILDKTIGRGHLLLRAFRRSPALRKRGVLIRAARIARIGSQVAAC